MKDLHDGRSLILASSSPFRQSLLQRLQLPFRSIAPEVDETAAAGEPPEQLASRLSAAKAAAVAAGLAQSEGDALIIGSDQVAELDGRLLGKPGGHQAAVAQLRAAAGNTVRFHTGLCLLDAASTTQQLAVEHYTVTFRELSSQQIERYVEREQPFASAGSFKAEGLGIALFQRMHGDDPTGLIGLPLIRLTLMLQLAGVDVL